MSGIDAACMTSSLHRHLQCLFCVCLCCIIGACADPPAKSNDVILRYQSQRWIDQSGSVDYSIAGHLSGSLRLSLMIARDGKLTSVVIHDMISAGDLSDGTCVLKIQPQPDGRLLAAIRLESPAAKTMSEGQCAITPDELSNLHSAGAHQMDLSMQGEGKAILCQIPLADFTLLPKVNPTGEPELEYFESVEEVVEQSKRLPGAVMLIWVVELRERADE